jgi:subtilase family serine protease
VADTNRAAASFGSPPLASGQYSAVLPAGYIDQNQCAPESWVGEQALDVQAIHTLAPAAQITYYGASSCLTLIDALNTAVAENKASVISNSWLYPGESMVPAANRQQLDSIAVQAAIQGQALLFSSGDSGDNSAAAASGRHEASFPASSPWVTAVGGTSVAVDGANKVSFSTGWEGSGNTLQGGQWASQRDADGRFVGGAGGGVSGMYDLPDYQKGKVPAGTKGRAIPDISALADAYTGMAIGYTAGGAGYVEFAGGGTSLAAPLLAGLVADAQQAQRVTRMGFLNEAIYVLSDKPAITDVIAVKAGVWTPSMISYGYVSVPSGQGDYLIDLDSKPQSLQSATGWDAVTGVGTPTAAFLTQLGK